MSQINLITPPDKLYNQAGSLLLVYPTEWIKSELQSVLLDEALSCNIYLYDINNNEHHYNWLLDVHKFCNICIINLDDLPTELKCMESYFISFPNTYWVSNGENKLYNKISHNHLYNLDRLKPLLREYAKIQ